MVKSLLNPLNENYHKNNDEIITNTKKPSQKTSWTQEAYISNSWTLGTEEIEVTWGSCAWWVFQVTAHPGKGAASSMATDAPLFLQWLFKGLIDRSEEKEEEEEEEGAGIQRRQRQDDGAPL